VVADSTIFDIIREGEKVKIHRADVTNLTGRQLHLSDGTVLETDLLIYATGYETHITVFNEQDCLGLGLPVRIDRLSALDSSIQYPSAQFQKAEEEVLRQIPRLRNPPFPPRAPTYTQYRLYNHIVPLPLLKADDRSLTFVGYLQGAGIAVINDVVALWVVAWMTGDLKLDRGLEEMEWEIDLYNAYVKRRYVSGGRQAPIAPFEWFSVRRCCLFECSSALKSVLMTVHSEDAG
jgi:dimethylaniline monooxygenase (N-oxide forming)